MLNLNEESSFWFRHRNRCILELTKKYARNEVVYDIGGGMEQFLPI